MQRLPETSFAEMAVELRLADTDWAEIQFGLWMQALCGGEHQRRMEVLVSRIGLPEELAARIVSGEYKHAATIARAHDFFRRNAHREKQIRGLDGPSPPSNDNRRPAWRRAISLLLGGARAR